MNWRRGLAWTAALLLLAAVFVSYVQPDLMRQLSEQIWACF